MNTNMDTLEPVIDSLRIKDILHKLLKERFDRIDIAAAADEVRPFLRDPRELVLWCSASRRGVGTGIC